MARPPLYKSDAERAAARKAQIRRNVKAFRERKLQRKHARDGTASTEASASPDPPKATLSELKLSFSITSHDNNSLSPSEQGLGIKEEPDECSSDDQGHLQPSSTPSPLSTDIVTYSASPPIELAFGYFEGIVRDGDAWQGGYPFWGSTQLLRGDDLVLTAVLSAATAGFGILYQDGGLARQSQESYHTALQLLRQRLARVGTVKNDAEGMGMIYANFSLTSVEFCENAWQGVVDSPPWLLHLRAGFKMMESAGPWAFRDAISLGSLRVLRSRIVLVAIVDEEPTFLDSDDWRSIPYSILDRTIEDIMWNLAEMVPAYLKRTTLLLQTVNVNVDDVKIMYNDLIALIYRFTTWYDSFGIQHDQPTHYLHPSERFHILPFFQRFVFIDLSKADILVSYWFHLFELVRRALTFRSHFHAIIMESNQSLDVLHQYTLLELAENICLSAEYIFYYPGRGFERLLRGFVPLRRVYDWYCEQPERFMEQRSWCWTVMEHIAKCEPDGGLAKHFALSILGPAQPMRDKEILSSI